MSVSYLACVTTMLGTYKMCSVFRPEDRSLGLELKSEEKQTAQTRTYHETKRKQTPGHKCVLHVHVFKEVM